MSNADISTATKDALYGGLVRLLRTTPFAELSVTAVCTRAGVSRMSFYRHYRKMSDILVSRLEEVLAELVVADTPFGADPRSRAKLFFASARAHHELYDAMLRAQLHHEVIECFNAHLDALSARSSSPHATSRQRERSPLERNFVVGGVYSLLAAWLHGGMKESDDSLADIVSGFEIFQRPREALAVVG